MTDKTTPRAGIAMNVAASAEALSDDAAAFAENPTQQNRDDLLASLRIARRRIDIALAEMGEKP